jgi:flagellar operon protein
MANINSSILRPAISGAPGSVPAKENSQAADRAIQKEMGNVAGDNARQTLENIGSFEQVLGSQLASNNISEPLKFSAHASARLQSRKLNMGPDEMRRLNEAVDKAAAKGLDDALILSKDGAFIVSVKNKTVVTAMDRNGLDGNVFTNIDGAVIM